MQTSYRSVKAMVARFFVEKIMLSGTKKSLTFRLRNNEYMYDGRNMTAYINKIRRKIEPNPARPRYILTVWGVGYKFNGEIKPADNVE